VKALGNSADAFARSPKAFGKNTKAIGTSTEVSTRTMRGSARAGKAVASYLAALGFFSDPPRFRGHPG
jgi:hypothetical protein